MRFGARRAVSAGALLLSCEVASQSPPPPPPVLVQLSDMRHPALSCAYQCPNTNCAEVSTPYACPALSPWTMLEHDTPCPAWDGSTYPPVTPGQCSASAPSGDAAAYAGPDGKGHLVLADGRWLAPAGKDWVFDDVPGGLTSGMTLVPGSSLALTVDTGYDAHVVRVVDMTLVGTGTDPTVAMVQFAAPETLNSGLVYVAPELVYVATDDGVVQALTLDVTSRTLVRDDARNLPLPTTTDGNGNSVPWYVSGLAASPDGTKLVVASVNATQVLVFDVASKQMTGQVDLGKTEMFGAWFDPNDPSGSHVYVSLWQDDAVAEVDVSNPAAPVVSSTFTTQKDPEGLAFLDSRFLVVGNDLGDSLTVVDRLTKATTSVPSDGRTSLYGQEPSALAFDPTGRQLYVTLAGMNAVAAYGVDTGTVPPTLSLIGRMPVGFWPSAIATRPDGSVVVANLRGHAEGPRPLYFDIGNADIADRMHGSIELLAPPSNTDLVQGDALVSTFNAVGARVGEPTVTCPNGANDFPVPADNQSGPSTRIGTVFIVVRENKGYDGIFGDFSGANGDPAYVFKSQPGEMDNIWHNVRALARTFAMSDNYYTQAIYSTQGHVWATYGRANDFDERTWAVSNAGRDARTVPGGGLFDVSRPVEGSLFDWLYAHDVVYDIMGEIVGAPLQVSATHPPSDILYPGGPVQNIGHSDLEKACYVLGRARGFCNFGSVVYMTLPNDHTFGVSPTNPTPETFCAVNDEATGMLLDGLSHSPLWASSLVILTEDDPSQGGEHVDNHRTPFVLMSPFVKHGYVSHTHIDAASIHKMLAHVLGLPYPNAVVANGAIPFDMFTSTPDYTPFTYTPHQWPIACGSPGMVRGEGALSALWDLSSEDAQPGLDSQVTRWMRGAPLASIPEETLAHVRALEARRR